MTEEHQKIKINELKLEYKRIESERVINLEQYKLYEKNSN